MSEYTNTSNTNASTPLSESPVPLLGPTGPGFGSPTPSLSNSVPVPGSSTGGAGGGYHYQYHGTASTPTHSAGYFPHFGSTSSGSSAGTSGSGAGGAGGPKMGKQSSSLSMDRAAFLMIRIKRIFQKKKHKRHTEAESKPKKARPPMLRARTLPAIIPPAFHIVGAQMLNRNANCSVNDYELTEATGGRSPELLIAKDGTSSNGVSPRHSVSSNSSNGSTCAGKDSVKGDKKTSFAKLTRLLSNNTGHKILTTSSGSFWTNKSTGNAALCQDGLSDVSCFFWNNKHNASKMKRTGSVDSLLSQVNGGQSDGGNGAEGALGPESPPGTGAEANYSSKHHHLTAKYSSASTKTYKVTGSPAMNSTKSSTYYLGSMLNSGGGAFVANDFGGGIAGTQHSFYGRPMGAKIPGKRQMSIDINASPLEGLMKKSERKKFEKMSKFNFDLQALFSAVENENFERTQMIVETTDVDINCTNNDGFTPLDISLMLLNMPLIKYLQSCGAREGDAFSNRTTREQHLTSMFAEAERCVHDLSIQSRQSANGSSSLSSAWLKEKEKQLVAWERRLRLVQRLKKGLELLEPPPPPLSVHVEIVGPSSLLVHYFPPIRLQDKKNIITKYKIEWSDNGFESILGSVEITNLAAKHEFIIDCLETERCYNVRIASGNCKGFSDYCYPLMNQSTPSSWKSVDSKSVSTISSTERVVEIDNLFRQIINSRQQVIENEMKRLSIDTETVPSLQQKRVRKSIKNFFGTANKFQKVMKRGVYFACLIYHEERVLVTNEEVLPIIEIDDSYTTSLQNDFYWLLKISCTWEDAKNFRRDMEKSTSSSLVQFRTRILSAIEQMQTSLGLIDLGKLFYKPLRDSEGTVVFCAIRALPDPKMISCLSLRWLPLTKLQKRLAVQQQALLAQQQLAASREVFSERVSDSGISVGWDGGGSGGGGGGCGTSTRLIGDILTGTMDEMIEYHRACNNQLARGLYIGYVKLRSSVDMMSVLVAKAAPNILPYAKIRENPHISKQEWAAVKLCLRPGSMATSSSSALAGSSSSLIHSNLSTSASQLYLATIQQQKEVVESMGSGGGGKENNSSANQFGNYLTASSPTPASPAPPATVATASAVLGNATKENASHLSQLFQLACSSMAPATASANLSRCSSSASTRTAEPAESSTAAATTTTATGTSGTGNTATNRTPRHLSFAEKLSFQQLLKFLQMLNQTAGHFLQTIGVTDAEHCDAHRLYSLEVIELSPDVSFILLLPPVDEVCSISTNYSADSLTTIPNLIYLPLKIFELIHMNTYQQNFTGRYSRISAMLESDIMVAQQAQREAFSSSEVATTKARLNQLTEFQTQLDEHCRSLRWIMDVVAFARDRQLAAGIPLMDVQYALGAVDKELLEEDADDRLYHIPAISLSTPNDGSGPKINVIASECNSTPSSPPPVGSAAMTRRKSRDDSYLEEHHRLQNHFNSLHHHRFHHQYSTHYHSDSLDSAGGELEPIERRAGTDSPQGDGRPSDVDLHALEQQHQRSQQHLDQSILGTGALDPSIGDEHHHIQSSSPPGAPSSAVSKSSFSLHSVHYVSPESRGSLTVDKAALEDMRRCVSASKLSGSYSDSPSSFCCYQNTPPSGGSGGDSSGGGGGAAKSTDEVNNCNRSSGTDRQRHPSSSSATNYFFGRDMEMYEVDGRTDESGTCSTAVLARTDESGGSSGSGGANVTSLHCCQLHQLRKSPEVHHLSNVSIDSLSDISITCAGTTSTTTATIGDGITSCYGGSQLSMNSMSTVQLLPYEEVATAGIAGTPLTNYASSPSTSSQLFATENYRPLSRALMFSSEGLLEDDLILEEDEDALLNEEREAAEARQLLACSKPSTSTYQPPRDIPELKIWPNASEEDEEEKEEKVEIVIEEVDVDSEWQTEAVNSTSFTDNFVTSPPAPSPVNRPQDIAISENLPDFASEATSEATTITSSCETGCESFPTSGEQQQQQQQQQQLMGPEKTDQLAVQSAAMCSLSVNSLSSAPPSSPSPTVIPATIMLLDSTAATVASSISASGSMSSFFNDNFEDILPGKGAGDVSADSANHCHSAPEKKRKNEGVLANLDDLSKVTKAESKVAMTSAKGKPPRPLRTHRRTIEMVKIVYKPPKRNKTAASATAAAPPSVSTTPNHSAFEFSLKKIEKFAFRNSSATAADAIAINDRMRVRGKKDQNQKRLMMRRRFQSCCPECCACTGSDSASNSGPSVSSSDPSTMDSTEAEEGEEEEEEDEDEVELVANENGEQENDSQYAPRVPLNNHSLKYPLDDRAIHRRRTASLQQNHLPASQQQQRQQEKALLSKRKMLRRRATITIHIAYECRVVPFGTAIKLKVTNRTLVAEIVETIVRYLHQMEKPLMTVTASLKNSTDTTKQQEPEDQRRLLKQKLKLLKQMNKETRAKEGEPVDRLASPDPASEPVSRVNLSRFSLLAVYASNIKHLNTTFPILNLQSPWNEAKLCLKYTAEEEEGIASE